MTQENQMTKSRQGRLKRHKVKRPDPVEKETVPNEPSVYLSFTLNGYEDGQPFERTLSALDRWMTQSAELILVNISSTCMEMHGDNVPQVLVQNDGGSPGPLSIKLRQDHKVPIGGQMWDTSIVLSCWFYKLQALGLIDLPRIRICEVGAGIGLLSLTLSLLHAQQVTATDMVQVIPILKENYHQNHSPRNMCIRPVDWANPPELPTSPFDLIIACDCIYSEVSSLDLALCLAKLCTETTVVYVVSEVRNESIQAAFLHAITPLFDVSYKDIASEVFAYIPTELHRHSMRFYVLRPKPVYG